MDRLFYPIGNLKGGRLVQGGGIGTGRYFSIDYSPPGDSTVPALSVSYRPSDDNETPLAIFNSGEHHLGNDLTIMRTEEGLFFGAYYEGIEKTTLDQDGNFETDGYVYTESYFQFLEQAADPPALVIDAAQLWVGDGTGLGDAGDFFFRVHQGGDPGSDTIIGFDISTFGVEGFVKNDANGILTGGNADGGGACLWRIVDTGNFFGPDSAGLNWSNGIYNLFGGVNAGNGALVGDYNVGLLYEALNSLNSTWADHNIGIGYRAGEALTGDLYGGGSNIWIGKNSGLFATVPDWNLGIGDESQSKNTTGWGNTGLGPFTQTYMNGGSKNASFGYNSLVSANANKLTGDENTTGGYSAGAKLVGDSNGNLCLGANTGPSSNTVLDSKMYIDNAAGTPLLGADFEANRVGILVDPSSINYVFEVVQGSATDPTADGWDVHPSDRRFKNILGAADNLLEGFRSVNVYRYQRKALVSDGEVMRRALHSKEYKKKHSDAQKKARKDFKKAERKQIKKAIMFGNKGPDSPEMLAGFLEKAEEEVKIEEVVDLPKLKQEMVAEKASLPKFKAERIGISTDDAEIPREILTFNGQGECDGISILGYIGWLHAIMKEQDGIIQELEQRVSILEAA